MCSVRFQWSIQVRRKRRFARQNIKVSRYFENNVIVRPASALRVIDLLISAKSEYQKRRPTEIHRSSQASEDRCQIVTNSPEFEKPTAKQSILEDFDILKECFNVYVQVKSRGCPDSFYNEGWYFIFKPWGNLDCSWIGFSLHQGFQNYRPTIGWFIQGPGQPQPWGQLANKVSNLRAENMKEHSRAWSTDFKFSSGREVVENISVIYQFFHLIEKYEICWCSCLQYREYNIG